MTSKQILITLMMFMISMVSWMIFSPQHTIMFYSILLIIMLTLLQKTSLCLTSVSSGLIYDSLTFWLVFLTLVVSASSWLAMSKMKKNPNFVSQLFGLMGFILVLTFFSKFFLSLYFLFEASLIPIFLIIMGWGYQPERLQAAKAMFLYTILGSLPLFLMILFLMKEPASSMTNLPQFLKFSGFNSWESLTSMSLILAFLIKFPMYGVHLWLPKAHVEAPVGGSMVLAGVLLKLGGFGMVRLAPYIMLNPITYFILFFSLFGGAWVGVICAFQTDMKILIAYSSVSHMSLSISTLLTKIPTATLGGKLMLICHGWSSAALFFGLNLLYLKSNSRSINFTKGLLMASPLLSLFWAITAASNMACPPSLNLFSEMIIIISLISVHHSTAVWLMLMVFIAAVYSLIMYSSTTQGKPSKSFKLGLIFSMPDLLNFVILIYLNFFMFLFITPLIL